jgi:hypothetical protein
MGACGPHSTVILPLTGEESDGDSLVTPYEGRLQC